MRLLLLISMSFAISLATTQPFPVDTIQWSGPADKRINFVFFGDGYQLHELEQYIEDVKQVRDHFFTQSPFSEYWDYFNIVAINVPSNVSGAARDPNQLIDNYFGSTFNSSGIERLLTATKSSKATDILFDQFPLFDQAVLIVNDDKYGGSGGWLATTSSNVNAPEIALHELGHSFANLSDEYWAGTQFAGETPNMTKESSPTLVRWHEWIQTNDVGVYPHSEEPSWHRPHQNCKMRVLNPPFCPVCKEAITKQIQLFVKPLVSYYPETVDFIVEDEKLNFQIENLLPQPNTLSVRWSLNGELLELNRDTVSFESSLMSEGENYLDVMIVDTTTFVRDDEHTFAQQCNVRWSIWLDATTSILVEDPVGVILYPNPIVDFLNLEWVSTQPPSNIHLEVFNLEGRSLLKTSSAGQNPITISLQGLPSGQYQLSVNDGSQSLVFPVIKL